MKVLRSKCFKNYRHASLIDFYLPSAFGVGSQNFSGYAPFKEMKNSISFVPCKKFCAALRFPRI